MMDKELFYVNLAEILELDRDEVTAELLLQDTIWDSLVVLVLIAMIDENYNVTVPAKELLQCQSVGEIVDLVDVAVQEKTNGL